MGWLKRLGRLLNSLENPAVPISSEAVMEVIGSTLSSGAGVEVTPGKALGLTALWRGIDMISSDVAKLPLDVLHREADGGKQRAREHPAYPLLRRRANAYCPAFRFKKTLTAHALLRGNGYALIVRDFGGRPRRLMILSPTPQTYPVEIDGVVWYVTTLAGKQELLRAEDVLHITGLSFDGLEGLDVLTVMCNALGLEIAQHEHAEKYFEAGTASPGFLVSPRRLGDKELTDLRNKWAKLMTGIKNRHSPGVLHGGVEFKPLGVDAQKAQLLESRKLGVREIANILGCPPHKLGDDSRTSYNSLEMENADYLQSALDPRLLTWEDECNSKLLTEAEKRTENVFCEFNRQAMLRVDYERRMAGYAKAREMGLLSANQICAMENMPSLGEEGERRFVPVNWVPLGEDGLPIVAGEKSSEFAVRGSEFAVRGSEFAVRGSESGGSESEVRGSESAVRQAYRALIVDRLQRLLAFEARNVQRAAEKEADFAGWAEEFYGKHESKLCEALLPLVRAWFAVQEWPRAAEGAAAMAAAWVAKSRQQLAESGQLAGEDLAAAWSGRVEELAEWILFGENEIW